MDPDVERNPVMFLFLFLRLIGAGTTADEQRSELSQRQNNTTQSVPNKHLEFSLADLIG